MIIPIRQGDLVISKRESDFRRWCVNYINEMSAVIQHGTEIVITRPDDLIKITPSNVDQYPTPAPIHKILPKKEISSPINRGNYFEIPG